MTPQERVDSLLADAKNRIARFAENQRLFREQCERESQAAVDAFSAGRFPAYMQERAKRAQERYEREYDELMRGPEDERQPDADAGSGGADGGVDAGIGDDP